MLKFKFLLWALTKLLQRAVKRNSACARYVAGKELVFQMQTRDGIGRHFSIRNGKVNSIAGLTSSPQFTMTFRNAARGFAILSAKDVKEAFLAALHHEDLAISGDFVEVMWFQGLTEYLQPKTPEALGQAI
ncbi:MAG: helicase [Burkholderiaceae bacterium]